ncbi:hypothetical protein [Kitasatospora sp. NBC_01300]|uniref:hypothetical protein n=1 Tax=Kitasatospora sp. NBC_01300 TaxID=2903574 RepID=UPI002F914FA2|nr:hypothetical protein OG556_37460 [Kitasatospora sp. NBC_01300]
MPFEADLAHALDRTTDSLEPDLGTLMRGAVQRGRIRRRRRTAGVIAGVGACAAIAAVGLVIPEVFAGMHSGGSDISVSAMAMPRSAITDTQMIQALEATFPGGRFSEESGQSNNPSNPSDGRVANGGLVLDDGHGAAYVGISALRLQLPLRDGDGLSCEWEPKKDGDTCRMSELPSSAEIPGGALVMYQQNAAAHPVRPDTARRWTVTVTLKATGAQLRMVQWNSTGGGTGGSAEMPKPTRPAPPLSEQQALAALTSPTWAPILGALG